MKPDTYFADCAKPYDPATCMVGQTAAGPGYHTRVEAGTWVHPTLLALDYALALLVSGETPSRAADIIQKVLTLQDVEPTSPTYGIWPWYLEEPLAQMAPPDWNWADFCGARLALILSMRCEHLPGDVIEGMRASLGHAAWSIFRRNVQPDYTNIAIMGAGVASAAGELLGEERLVDYGRRRLQAVVKHTVYHGDFNEYNSPAYTKIALEECERILQMVGDPESRAAAEELRRHAWEVVTDHFHPATGQWSGPHSRTYSDRLTPGTLHFLSVRTGLRFESGEEGQSFVPVKPLPCPPELVARFQTLPRERVELRQGFVRRDRSEYSVDGTTWMTGEACLGSANYEILWTQRRPLIGYWRTGEDQAVVLRLRFLHDGRDFSSAWVRNVQHGGAVLSIIGLSTDHGDWHPVLDRPRDGVFEAKDFRVRYELSGRGVQLETPEPGRFALAAGEWAAVLYPLPGCFGSNPLIWQAGHENGCAFLEGVCYSGPQRIFDPAALGKVVIACGLKLMPRDELPPAPPTVRHCSAFLLASWRCADREFRIEAPLHPGPLHARADMACG